MKKVSFIITTIALGIITNFISTQLELKNRIISTEKDEITYSEKTIDNREIVFTNFDFGLWKHKWFVRLGGLLILVFPWFFSPWNIIFAKEIREKKFTKGFIETMVPQSTYRELTNEIDTHWRKILIPLNIIYLCAYFGIVWATANYLDFSFTKYTLLSAERILNFCFSFI